MATDIYTDPQSKDEIIGYLVDFVRKLPEGETISGAEVTHVPPNDDIPAAITADIDESAVTFEFGPVEALGLHQLKVLASLSNGQKAEVRLNVPVNW